ncbi:MAG: TylF/MycF/NovP-related O-methyltransferase, partial [Candidatus Dormibacteria bacterium]
PRVKFFKGWFNDTVPGYRLPDHEILFVNCDADLYSSTHTILTYIGPHLRSGDYLYFDEFHHNHQERKAFDEFVLSSGFQFTLVGCSQSRSQVLFART